MGAVDKIPPHIYIVARSRHYHDDEGQVHADGEVREGQHVRRNQLEEHDGLDHSVE